MQNTLRKENAEHESSGFVVDNDRKAVWCLRKIKHLKEKQAKNEKLAESEIEDIQKEIDEVQKWLDEENDKLQNSINFFEPTLYSYALELRKEDPELKTHKLPFGQLQFRKKRPKWKYDNEKLLEFVEKNYEELVKVRKNVDKRKLKSWVKIVGGKVIMEKTGEVIEGVEVEERPEKFNVKIK
jgi:hypothetical protein